MSPLGLSTVMILLSLDKDQVHTISISTNTKACLNIGMSTHPAVAWKVAGADEFVCFATKVLCHVYA